MKVTFSPAVTSICTVNGYRYRKPGIIDQPRPRPYRPFMGSIFTSFRMADEQYQKFTTATRMEWRKAVKKRHTSSYDLWMKEALFNLYRGYKPPDHPSIHGGYSVGPRILPGAWPEITPACLKSIALEITTWSYFEPLDPYFPWKHMCSIHTYNYVTGDTLFGQFRTWTWEPVMKQWVGPSYWWDVKATPKLFFSASYQCHHVNFQINPLTGDGDQGYVYMFIPEVWKWRPGSTWALIDDRNEKHYPLGFKP